MSNILQYVLVDVLLCHIMQGMTLQGCQRMIALSAVAEGVVLV